MWLCHLETLVEFLPHMMWTAKAAVEVDFVNDKWCTYTGVTAEQSVGQGWKATFFEEDIEPFVAAWHSAQSTRREIEVDCRVFSVSDNRHRWHLIRLVPTQSNREGIQWLVTLTEIERFKNAEQSLLQNELRLNDAVAAARQDHEQIEQLLISYLHNMPALSFIKDEQGRYLYASKSFCEFFEIEFEKLVTTFLKALEIRLERFIGAGQ